MARTTTDTVLRALVIGGIMLIPLIPLVVSHSLYFPFITGKNLAFQLIIQLVVAGWLILAVRDTSARPLRTWLFIPLLVFLVVVALANAFGINLVKSFWSNFERMEGYITLLHLAGLFLVATAVLTTERLWWWFFHISLGVCTVVAVSGINQSLTTDISRIDIFLGNPIYVAVYLLLHIFLAGVYLVRSLDREIIQLPFSYYVARRAYIPWYTLSYGIVITLFVVALLFTGTRSAMLGLLGGVFVAVALIALLDKGRPKVRRVAASIVAIALVVGGTLGGIVALNHIEPDETHPVAASLQDIPVLNRFASINVTEGDAAARFRIWEMAFAGFLERPILGWGQENFSYIFNKHYNPDMYDRESWFDRAHNVFLDWLTASGILGLLAYLSMFAGVAWLVWRDPSGRWSVYEKGVLVGLLVAYAIHNLFVFDSITSYILFFAVMAYVATQTTPKDRERVAAHLPSASWYSTYGVVAPIIILLVAGSLYISTYKPMLAGSELLKAAQPASGPQQYEQRLESFRTALSYDTVGTQEIREQLALTIHQIPREGQYSDVREKYMAFTGEQLEKHFQEHPRQTRPYVFWGLALFTSGDTERAVSMLQKALENSPKKQDIHLQLAQVYIEREEYEKAREAARTAYELAPQFIEPAVMYVITLYLEGERSQSDEVFASLSEEAVFSDRLMNMYVQQDDWQRSIDLRQRRIEILVDRLENSPGSEKLRENIIQEQVLLASTLSEAGRQGEAVALLRELKEEYPLYSDQFETFIQRVEENGSLR